MPLADVRTRLTKPKQVVLLKFLRAREWNAVAACDMLIKCLKVRGQAVRAAAAGRGSHPEATRAFSHGSSKQACILKTCWLPPCYVTDSL